MQVCDPPFYFVIAVAATYKVKKVLKRNHQTPHPRTVYFQVRQVLRRPLR